jgi:hypothetical protein
MSLLLVIIVALTAIEILLDSLRKVLLASPVVPLPSGPTVRISTPSSPYPAFKFSRVTC